MYTYIYIRKLRVALCQRAGQARVPKDSTVPYRCRAKRDCLNRYHALLPVRHGHHRRICPIFTQQRKLGVRVLSHIHSTAKTLRQRQARVPKPYTDAPYTPRYIYIYIYIDIYTHGIYIYIYILGDALCQRAGQARVSEHLTPNPKPSTPNPKPQTPNPKPQTFNPNP